MAKKNSSVTEFINKDKTWQQEIRKLRELLLENGLTEEFKWRAPCYTHESSNIVIIGRLKKSCTLGFFKGVLLSDPQSILVAPGPNSQSARVVRFESLESIESLSDTIGAYIKEAIELEAKGAKVDFNQKDEIELPDELLQTYDENPLLKSAFESLTPGRRRAYVLHFTSAKQSKTRKSRVENCIPRIMAGKGMHDCICGLSDRMPRCDGSHQRKR
ncbi:DUF1801 domain-containing protein [Rhodopirellula sp. MGV]|uniref:DUF1801 domain-containing protein n=1 Tax=Rhodopirellula sp. MGV TaxID=2023130 RepID=UPI000B965287|nr:DUF1801 domain-containing protein [Rhodopirellula sp. MGV]OYP32973.1 hypothetical protein CGZ80_18915 [Rhodopirellula sp. MGV]PNY35370.1 hypothetical protein C2E31_17795 [Rhodopirellula baltica]